MPAVKLSPLFNDQQITSTGAPASGYKLYTYAAGSSTQLATYTDSTGTVAQTNPIILNSSGYPANPIWLQTGLSHKFVLKDSNDNVIRTVDNISGVNDASISASQWQAAGLTPTYISASSFSLQGDQTTAFHPGRRLQFTTTAGTVYGVISTSAYAASITTVTMRMDGTTALDSGLSAVNLSILTANGPSLPSVGPAFSAALASGQAVATGTATKLQLAQKDYDTANCYDNATNFRFTPNVAGYYSIKGTYFLNSTTGQCRAILYKNGSAYKYGTLGTGGADGGESIVAADVFLNGSTDYVELYGYQNSGSTITGGAASTTYFQGHLARLA